VAFVSGSAIQYTYRWPNYASSVAQEGAPASIFINDSSSDDWEIVGYEYRVDIDSNLITVEFLGDGVQWATEDPDSFVGQASFNGINFSFDVSITGLPRQETWSTGSGLRVSSGSSEAVAMHSASQGNLAVDWKGFRFSGSNRLSWVPFDAPSNVSSATNPLPSVVAGQGGDDLSVSSNHGFNAADPYNSILIVRETQSANLFSGVFTGQASVFKKGKKKKRTGDVVTGSDGDDRVFGTPYADTLIGGAGNDYLEGGNGKDALYGGAGSNRYALAGLTKGNGDSVFVERATSSEYADLVDGFDSLDSIYLLNPSSRPQIIKYSGDQYGVFTDGLLQVLVQVQASGHAGIISEGQLAQRLFVA